MYFVNFLLIKPIMCSKNANIFAFSYPGNFIVAGFEQYESYARTSQFFVPMPFLENFYKWGTKLLVPVRWPSNFETLGGFPIEIETKISKLITYTGSPRLIWYFWILLYRPFHIWGFKGVKNFGDIFGVYWDNFY